MKHNIDGSRRHLYDCDKNSKKKYFNIDAHSCTYIFIYTRSSRLYKTHIYIVYTMYADSFAHTGQHFAHDLSVYGVVAEYHRTRHVQPGNHGVNQHLHNTYICIYHMN